MKIVALLAVAFLVTLANPIQAQGNYKKVCYYANWAIYRPSKLIIFLCFIRI